MLRKLAPALVVPLLLVTACAKEADDAVEVETGAAAVEAVRAAPEAASDAGTAAFEMVMTLTGFMPGAGDVTLDLTATGVFDADAQQMAMEMDLGAMLAGLAAATGETVPPEMALPARFVVDGGVFYLRMPMLDALTGSSGWLSMTPEDLGQSAGSLGLGSGAFDPSQMLEVLRGTSGGVEADGQEQVRGVPTTNYRATVNMADALESVPADEREELEAQLDQLGAGNVDLPVEVWVDGYGLPRRFSMTFDNVAGPPLGDGGMTMTIDFFDYGEPVDIEVPAPDEVTPFGDVLGGFAGAFGEAGA